jgi:hypothetical protein
MATQIAFSLLMYNTEDGETQVIEKRRLEKDL